MPYDSGTLSGLIGIRPFYTTGNYTERSSIISSNAYEWCDYFLIMTYRNTNLAGNYVNQDYILQIYNASTIASYDYERSIWMCLTPTELCVSPFRVPQTSINI